MDHFAVIVGTRMTRLKQKKLKIIAFITAVRSELRKMLFGRLIKCRREKERKKVI